MELLHIGLRYLAETPAPTWQGLSEEIEAAGYSSADSGALRHHLIEGNYVSSPTDPDAIILNTLGQRLIEQFRRGR